MLVEYTDDEAIKIAAGKARGLGFGQRPLPWGPDREWLAQVAQAGYVQPTPHGGRAVALRDYALSADELPFNGRCYDLTVPLEWTGMTHDGLDVTAQAYLVRWPGRSRARRVSGRWLRRWASAAGSHTEQSLMAKGFLLITPRGRSLTEAGWVRAADLIPCPDEDPVHA